MNYDLVNLETDKKLFLSKVSLQKYSSQKNNVILIIEAK